MPASYSLGCPVWSCEHWRGGLYTAKARRDDWLRQYSSVFDTVEGNGSFYRCPTTETMRRWADAVPAGFEFCMKVPRTITHDARLRGAGEEKRAFLRCLETLAAGDALGPTLMQLGPSFDAGEWPALEASLRRWPQEFPLAVEVRHRDYHDRGPIEDRLDDTLAECGHDRVLFDSRALFARPPQTECERVSQTRKPRTPLRHTATGRRPFVRFIGRDDVSQIDPWIEEWSRVVAGWIKDGLRPLVLTHAPDDAFAPAFARRFHEALRPLIDADGLPAFPGESEVRVEQAALF